MLRKSLAAKLIVYIGLVLILTISLFAVINTNAQKKFLIEQTKQNGIQIGQMIEQSLADDMMTEFKERVQTTLEDIGQSVIIEGIRIFDKSGTIFSSNTSTEIGLTVDMASESCIGCHSADLPVRNLAREDQTRIFPSADGRRLLGIINPIYNAPRCSNASCHFHPAEQDVLGVMDIHMPLERFDTLMAVSRRRTLLYFLFIFLILAGGSGLLIQVFVNRPIGTLIEGTQKIAGGNLDYKVGSLHSDEIGVLGQSFDSMTGKLKQSYQEIANWNIRLEEEVRKATQNLEKANKKLQELDSLKSNFMRKMEHGLRSHVGIIQSCLSLVYREELSGLTTQQLDLISTAKRRSAMLLEVLDDIVELSYRQSSKVEYAKATVRIDFILHRVLEDFRAQAEKKNISVDVHISPSSSTIQADSEAIKEVFSNLVNNAIKYTPANGTVRLSATETSDTITVEVQDTGIGIAEDELPRIFEEFYRASNAKAKKIEGTGVGMAIVREIVKAHEGTIELESELTKGTSVTVVLPKIRKE